MVSTSREVKIMTRVRNKDLNKLNLVKFCYDGQVSGSSNFSQLPQLPHKKDAHYKSGKKELKYKHLVALF